MCGKHKIFRLMSFFVFLFFTTFASSKATPKYGIFVYSNFCISAMSGDLYGNRITFSKLIDANTLIYEYTDGATHAVLAESLKFDLNSGKVTFEVHAEGNLKTTVLGRFSDDGSRLTVQGMLFNEEEKVTLKLISDFASPIQKCKE